ncbi:copper resistance D family protein [Sciscionella sediminilitoris]|uniref:copper resistance D family protein n=1 Tax=Sciscionella sediminilitoris TaxID=1445613 RepID=UPI0004DFB8CE|nr:CopD family protein [Sciscionella sp. SE31]
MRALPFAALAVVVALTAAALGVATIPIAVPGIPNSPPAIGIGISVLRGVFYLAAVALLGVHLLPALGASKAGTQPIAACAALVLGASALGQLVLQSADFRPERPVTLASIGEYVVLVGAGKAQVFLFALAVALAVLAVLDARRGGGIAPALPLLVSGAAVLVLPLVGHATDQPDWRGRLGTVAMELHVLGALVWTGGLLAVLYTARHPAATVLARFSTVAGTCLALVTVTGICFGLLQLAAVPGIPWYVTLFRNDYGLLLCAKLVCLLALSGLGAAMRYRVLPAVLSGARGGFARLAVVELAVLGLAIGVAVVLTRTPLQQ